MSKSTRGEILTGGADGAATESRHRRPGRELDGLDGLDGLDELDGTAGPRQSRGIDDQGGHWRGRTDWRGRMG